MMYCNPVNLDYKYQIVEGGNTPFREAADPSVVYFQGYYWIFASVSKGAWYSVDLDKWKYIDLPNLPEKEYAPDVRVHGGYIYFTSSRRKGEGCIRRCTDLFQDTWEVFSIPFPYWDPNLFFDDDGSIYLYWGCDPRAPIYGIQLDKKTFQPIGEKVPMFYSDIKTKGYERGGENNKGKVITSLAEKIADNLVIKGRPYNEGPWMTKHNGRYYLQYATPGTEWNIYSDAVYVSDSPLSGFQLQSHNPFSLKAGGFITGAGHGSTFEDVYGNLWHMSTMTVTVNHKFERRVGLFPAGIDADGILYCNTSFGDYPQTIPNQKIDASEIFEPKYQLLSYKKPVVVSSEMGEYRSAYLIDENVKTSWVSGEQDEMPSVVIDLQKVMRVNAIQMNFSDVTTKIDAPSNEVYDGELCSRIICHGQKGYSYKIYASSDNVEWVLLQEVVDSMLPHNVVEIHEIDARYVKVVFSESVNVSGIRVFGSGYGEKPSSVTAVESKRTSPMNVELAWKQVGGSVGYNVCYGIGADKLYNSILVYEKSEVELTSLIAGVEYYVRVDSFNENGVTKGKAVEVI